MEDQSNVSFHPSDPPDHLNASETDRVEVNGVRYKERYGGYTTNRDGSGIGIWQLKKVERKKQLL